MAKYYTVVVLQDGVWHGEHGTYDRDEANDELDCYKHHPYYDGAKIVTSLDVTEAINETIAELNK